MALDDFYCITNNDDHTGLVWAGEVQKGKYFAELQTGVLPQLVHLVIFDMENNFTPVYEALQSFQLGDRLDDEKLGQLNRAIQIGLATLAEKRTNI